MILTSEWDWDVAKEVWQEEARDEGIHIGEARAAIQYVAQIADNQRRIADLERQLAARR
jgi:hypothetical protein